jgi:hypothetical protein
LIIVIIIFVTYRFLSLKHINAPFVPMLALQELQDNGKQRSTPNYIKSAELKHKAMQEVKLGGKAYDFLHDDGIYWPLNDLSLISEQCPC